MEILSPEATILTVTQNGYGKRTPLDDYRIQNRGGQGVITIRTTPRNGEVVGVAQVVDDDEVMFITDGGKVLRARVSGISTMGRATQGVRVMNLDAGREDPVDGAARRARRRRAGEQRRRRRVDAPAPAASRCGAEFGGHLSTRESKRLFERARRVIPGRRQQPRAGLRLGRAHAALHRARPRLPRLGRRRQRATSTTSAPGGRWCSATPTRACCAPCARPPSAAPASARRRGSKSSSPRRSARRCRAASGSAW